MKDKRRSPYIVFATHEQTLRTDGLKTNIEDSRNDPKCKLCKNTDDTVEHICCCKKMAQNKYMECYNKLATMVNGNLQKYDLSQDNILI